MQLATGSRKSTMAAVKPEVHLAIRLDINAVSKAIPMFSGSAYPTVLAEIMQHAAGSRKSNMAAVKPEVLLSQLLD